MEQHLVAALERTLSPDASIRTQAETGLLQAHADASCGLALCHIVLNTQAPLPLRQSAAVSLRKWIRERWSPLAETFIGFPPEGHPVQSENKGGVRQALLQILALPGQGERKLRVAAAACLSLVCSSDWPDEFPELLPSVHQMLQPTDIVSPEDRDRVHGALAFLSEFWSSEMDERQILGGAKDMLPTIEALLADTQAYPASLRCRCVLIFRQLLSSLFMVREVYPEASKQIANDVLPRWTHALQGMSGIDMLAAKLGSADLSAEEKHGEVCLVNEIWRTLKIASHFRPQLKAKIPELLTSAIHLLRQLEDPFSAYYLDTDAEPPFAVAEGDSDIETTLPNLLCSVIDFIAEASRGDRGRAIFVSGSDQPSDAMSALVTVLVSYARITSEEEEDWTSDANAFVAASEKDAIEYGLRVAAADLCQDLLEAYPKAASRSLGAAVTSSTNSGKGWKSVEAALAVLGGVAEEVTELVRSDSRLTSDGLDLQDIFQRAVSPSVQGQVPALLTGRAYIFASQFAATLPAELAEQFVEASVQALEAETLGGEEETLIVKLSAVRCIKNFYRQLSSALLSPFTGRIIARLGPLLMQANGDTLILILETIQCIVGEQEGGEASVHDIATETYAQIASAVLTIWKNNVKDFILLSVVSDLLESLASQKAPRAASAVLNASQPLLVSALQTAMQPVSDEDADLLEPAVTLIDHLLMGASAATLQETGSVSHFVGPLCSAVQGTEDRDVLQSGISALTLLVRKSPAEVVAWRANDGSAGNTAIDHFTAIISRVLLLEEESAGLKVGDLIVVLLRKVPQEMLPILPGLLDGMVRRLSKVKTASFAQSLIVPFAFLMKDQCQVVVQLLKGINVAVEDEEGNSQGQATGLAVLGKKWMDNAETLQGYWAQKTSTIALAKLLETSDESLATISVKGDLIPDTSNTIRTRSRAKLNPHRYTSIPLSAKILKILIAEYDTAGDGPPSRLLPGGLTQDDEDLEEEDGDDDWDDDEPETGKKHITEDRFLSSLLNADMDDLNALAAQGDADLGLDDDAEGGLETDEVWQMDLKVRLV
ncbi:ARM repeat-containing protein [Microstroma glucosiphilum]|uniref:ARM repeat-containing protein n=1 Tax=Pseudomicrostroma glucosiphilum TaxID=1684307 RepID=A0A316U2M8_9BASI|nr:ARM repeat-containing protein [Pseudomicrostroma glucosiphilum]PWN19599.1 ARM repeat-containing protein [Pseudomicrostroma glucosiphilum]